MKYYASIFKKATGEIVQSLYFEAPDEDAEYAALNMQAAVLAFGAETHDYAHLQASIDTQYIQSVGGELVAVDKTNLFVTILNGKTTLLADGIDSVQLEGLPIPCEVIVDDPDPNVETQTYEVTGGGFILTADDPGIYTVEVRRFPFLPFLVEFTAT